MKNNTKPGKLYEKYEENVKKTIYCSLICAKLIHIMQNLVPKHTNPNMVIDKRLLTFGLYQTLLLDIVYGFVNDNNIEMFFKIYFKYTHSQK